MAPQRDEQEQPADDEHCTEPGPPEDLISVDGLRSSCPEPLPEEPGRRRKPVPAGDRGDRACNRDDQGLPRLRRISLGPTPHGDEEEEPTRCPCRKGRGGPA